MTSTKAAAVFRIFACCALLCLIGVPIGGRLLTSDWSTIWVATAAVATALSAAAIAGATAYAASQFIAFRHFEQTKLTVQLFDGQDIRIATDELTELLRRVGNKAGLARDIVDQAIRSQLTPPELNDAVRAAAHRSAGLLTYFAAIYSQGSFQSELFLARAAWWIVVGTFIYLPYLRQLKVVGAVQDDFNQMLADSLSELRKKQPQTFDWAPELEALRLV